MAAQVVIAISALERVIALSALQLVVSGSAVQAVVAVLTLQEIGPLCSGQIVPSRAAQQRVIAAVALQKVIAVAPQQGVASLPAIERIGTVTAQKAVVVPPPAQNVVAQTAIDRVAPVAALQRVVAVSALQPVVTGLPVDVIGPLARQDAVVSASGHHAHRAAGRQDRVVAIRHREGQHFGRRIPGGGPAGGVDGATVKMLQRLFVQGPQGFGTRGALIVAHHCGQRGIDLTVQSGTTLMRVLQSHGMAQFVQHDLEIEGAGAPASEAVYGEDARPCIEIRRRGVICISGNARNTVRIIGIYHCVAAGNFVHDDARRGLEQGDGDFELLALMRAERRRRIDIVAGGPNRLDRWHVATFQITVGDDDGRSRAERRIPPEERSIQIGKQSSLVGYDGHGGSSQHSSGTRVRPSDAPNAGVRSTQTGLIR